MGWYRVKSGAAGAIAAACLVGGVACGQSMARLEIDATDLPRFLLRATMTIPLDGAVGQDAADGELALWYPKWVPGSHAPGGPIQNVAGLRMTDEQDREVPWGRTPGEVCRLLARPAAGAREIRVEIRYITNQPSDNSHGLDSWGSEAIGIISPNTVLLCPEVADMTRWSVETTLLLPKGWRAATALTAAGGDDPDRQQGGDAGPIRYAPETLELLIDSPIMAGRHMKTYDLTPDAAFAARTGVNTPPHRLHVFSEVETAVRINDTVLERYRAMIAQASILFGSHPFESMDILLATTNVLPRNGLEHLRSTLNVIPLSRLDAPDQLTGWDRMLVPHEYVHAWCGKYRSPAGMLTGDLFTPQDTELLWVYEGLTQHLGQVLEVRSGLMTREEYEWDLLNRVRWARHQQGRDWRPLADTGAASHTLRSWSALWGHLRRSQDYYDEGALLWLEADAIIRRISEDRRSLDDFCRSFFARGPGDPVHKGYDRTEVIRHLNQTAAYDWDSFVRDRVERPTVRLVSDVAGELGFSIQFSNTSPVGPRDFRIESLDCRDSLGVTFGGDGSVGTVLLGSPADAAGLAPRMRIVAIGEHVWSRQRLIESLERSTVTGQIDLLVTSGDRLVTRTIDYDGGPRFMTLVRVGSKPDVLAEILRPQ